MVGWQLTNTAFYDYSLQGMKKAVSEQLVPSNLEISIVGDFDESSLDEKLLRYLGTIPPSQTKPKIGCAPLVFQNPSVELHHQQWHLKVSVRFAFSNLTRHS